LTNSKDNPLKSVLALGTITKILGTLCE